MTISGIAVPCGVALPATAALAASLTYSDGICQFRAVYDPAKIDGARLRATFAHLFEPGPPREVAPAIATQEEIAAIDVPAYRARCAAHHGKLAALRLVDLPGVEALRAAEIDELDTTCNLAAASLAAAKGDLAPARALAPACTRYTDLLALPPDQLKARFNDLVMDLCAASTERNVCAGQLQRSGEGPGSPGRRRLAVVDRWRECATGREPDADPQRQRLRAALAARFKAKTLSCAR